MKKTISILFLILYTALNTGLIVGVHNCLFEGSNVFVGKTETVCCCADSGEAEDSTCCEDTSFVVKLDEVQTVSEVLQFKLQQPIIILPYFFATVSYYLEHLNTFNSFTLNQLSSHFTWNNIFKTPKFILYHQAVLYA